MADNISPQQLGIQRAREQRSQNYFNMLSLNEGNESKVYKDGNGIPHIGIGFNLEDAGNRKFLKQEGINIDEILNGRKITQAEKIKMYNHSLTQAFNDAMKFDSNFARRPEPVKKALVDMAFNLGLTKLNKFVDMKAALKRNDYRTAADEMVDSLWYDQVKSRGPRTVKLMRSAVK